MRPGQLRRDTEAARRFLQSRGQPLARTTPLRRRRRRPLTDAETALALIFWDEAMRQGRCAKCGYDVMEHLQAHHAIDKGIIANKLRHLPREHLVGLCWDYRNALALCAEPAPNRCHDRHTVAFERVPRSALRPCVWEFALELDELAPGHLSDPFTAFLEGAYPELEAA